MTLWELMMPMTAFVFYDVAGMQLWEADLGDTEIIVAGLDDGSIQITHQVGDKVPLLVSFNRCDESIRALLKEWSQVSVS